MLKLYKLATWPGLPALCIGTRRRALTRSYVQLASDSSQKQPLHGIKKEGTVAEIFQDPVSEGPPLSPRFAELKREMCVDRDALVHSWRAVLKELEEATEEIAQHGNEVRIGCLCLIIFGLWAEKIWREPR